jgi:hypothetical protein
VYSMHIPTRAIASYMEEMDKKHNHPFGILMKFQQAVFLYILRAFRSTFNKSGLFFLSFSILS